MLQRWSTTPNGYFTHIWNKICTKVKWESKRQSFKYEKAPFKFNKLFYRKSMQRPEMRRHILSRKAILENQLNILFSLKYAAYLEDCVQSYRSIYRTRRDEPVHHMLTVPYYNYTQHKIIYTSVKYFFYSAPRL